MKNYTIKVSGEVESREAQELFFELGYRWPSQGREYLKIPDTYTHLTVYSHGALTMGFGDADEEITLPLLRDLVVLHRNDVADATHADNYHDGNLRFFMTSDRDVYVYETNGFERGWIKSGIYPKELTPIKKTQSDPQLISGADALRAIANGDIVQAKNKDSGEWHDLDTDDHNIPLTLLKTGKNRNGFEFIFRLKPQTITINDSEYQSRQEAINAVNNFFGVTE